DFGMLLLRTSQASSAARDGARLGILNYAAADVSGSADRTAIEEAVRAKLVGLSVSSIEVDCVDEDDSVLTCADASPNVDFIRVRATWDYEPLTFVGSLLGEHSFSSTSK